MSQPPVIPQSPAQPIQPKAKQILSIAKGQHVLLHELLGREAQDVVNVLISKKGPNLRIQLPDGTDIDIENFYPTCAGQACSIHWTDPLRGSLSIDTDRVDPLDGDRVVYAQGDHNRLMALATSPTALSAADVLSVMGLTAGGLALATNARQDSGGQAPVVELPSAPTLALRTDSGSSDSDGISTLGEVTVSGIETGASWAYSTDGGIRWNNGTGSSFTLPPATYAAGDVQVRQTDLAGNTSEAASNTVAITVDTTAPSAPAFALSTDSGSSDSDGISTLGEVTVSGIETGASWAYSTDGGTNWNNGTGSSFTLSPATYAAGDVQVRQTDLAGNTSEAFANPTALLIDQTAPGALTLSLDQPGVQLPSQDRTTVVQSGAVNTSFDNSAPPAGIFGLSVRLSGTGENSGMYFIGLPIVHWVLGSARGADGTDDFLISNFLLFGFFTLGQSELVSATIPVGDGDDRATGFIETNVDDKNISYLVGYSDGADGTQDFSIIAWDQNLQNFDLDFSDDGKLMVPIGNRDDRARSILPITDDQGQLQQLLLLGETTSDAGDTDAALIKLNLDGSLDTGFGTDGKLVLRLGSGDDTLEQGLLLEDASLLAIGTQGSGALENDALLVVRLLANGDLDTGWANNGTLTLQIDGLPTRGLQISQDANGKIVVSGYVVEAGQADAVVWRLNADGSLDTTFGEQGALRFDMPFNQVPRTLQINTKSGIFGDADTLLLSGLQVAPDGTTGLYAISIAPDGQSYSAFGSPMSLTNDQAGYTVFMDEDGNTSESFGRIYKQGEVGTLLSPLLNINNSNMTMESSGAVVTIERNAGAQAGDHFALHPDATWQLFEGSILDDNQQLVGQYELQTGRLVLTFKPNTADHVITALVRQITYRNDASSDANSRVDIDIVVTDNNDSGTSIVKRTVNVYVQGSSADLYQVTGLESDASWEFSLDGGAHWTTGSGSRLNAQGASPAHVLVRQFDVAGNRSVAVEVAVEDSAWQYGTEGDDDLDDEGQSQTLVGRAGDDRLTATAASALYGGMGDDEFIVNAAMITALESSMGNSGNNDRLASVHGGGGIDTLALAGAGLVLDLTAIISEDGNTFDLAGRLESIEILDLTGSGNNTLKLTSDHILHLGSVDVFQDTERHQWLVKGDAGDTVDLADGDGTSGWTLSITPVQINHTFYEEWIHNSSQTSIYVESGVSVV